MANLRFCPGCRGGAYTRTRVDYARIMADFTDAGQFGPEIHALARQTQNYAEKLAPRRTGRMAKQHYRNIPPPRGYERYFFVGNRAGYAKFVRNGTANNGAGYITGNGGPMELRPIPYSWFRPDSPGRFKDRVKGQKAQDWLTLAIRLAVYVNLYGRLPDQFASLGE